MGEKSRRAKLERLRQLVNMCRSQGAESDWSAILREAARTLHVMPTSPPLLYLSDPGLYLDFFGKTLEFAIFPHKSRRPLATNTAIDDKARA